ncbi:MAG: DsbE family thiol:disulfide interchange protein [Gammaproteobacteria bacterium]|nr:DsbE family thiol:disulfide interchange protein [Gammaproteobacteria bacterium]MDH5613422.1 DsbE family thiol:disulfide interchange protein [Gammaproteobacteria bacterium]
MNRYLWPLGIFIALVILLGVGLTLNPREVPSPFIGKPAPAFVLPTVHDTNKQFSHEEFKGKVSLFNVWASWCVACREEHPLLVELSKTSDIPIYGLNYKDKIADAKRWLKTLGNPYIDSASDIEGKAGFNWGVYGVPETFLIDKKGIIRYKKIGPITTQDLKEKILPLVKQLRGEAG